MVLDRLRRTLSSIINVGKTILFVVVVSWKAAPVHVMAWGLVTAVTEREEYELEERLWRKCLELDFPPYPDDPFYKSYVMYAKMRCPAYTQYITMPLWKPNDLEREKQ